MQDWRAMERLVALLSADEYGDSFTVIPNARIKGYISQRKRQIDVLVEYRYSHDLSRRVIIDAKLKKRPVDIKEVEAFEGLMRDVQAKHGILVCANGHTKSALKRAQDHIGIRLVSPEGIKNLDLYSWDPCLASNCSDGLVLWDATPGIFVDGMVSVQSVGKCDRCGMFHIWCWDCGNRKSLTNEDEWQCSCKGPWFWLTSIEEDEDSQGNTNKCVYLFMCNPATLYEIVDRRPL